MNSENQLGGVRCVLIGLRGSGKTTIGREVAVRIGGAFVDLDDLTAEHLGEPTAGEALRLHGEPAFREAEAAVLDRALSAGAGSASRRRAKVVLALGGGTPTAPGAAERLRRWRDVGGIVVYLRAEPNELRRRLAQTDLTTRPALTQNDAPDNAGPSRTLSEIDAVFAARDPLYRQLGDIIDVATLSAADVTDRVVSMLAGDSSGPAPR